MQTTNLWPIPDQIPSRRNWPRSSIPRRRAPLEFDVVGEDVLITGARPIGIMPPASTSTSARNGRHRRQRFQPEAGR